MIEDIVKGVPPFPLFVKPGQDEAASRYDRRFPNSHRSFEREARTRIASDVLVIAPETLFKTEHLKFAARASIPPTKS
jgi:hypothetical protein